MKVPFLRPRFGRAEIFAAERVMLTSNISTGPERDLFEKAFSEYVGTRALTVCNGSVALDLIWKTLIANEKLKKGDKVLCPSFTFVATANSIVNAGLVPVFCDIEPSTWNMDISGYFHKYCHCKAILAVHTFGNPCDMHTLITFKEQFRALLIEDCAEACGAKYKGKRVGSFGNAAAFSFNATKNLTTGEGGAVCFKDPADIETAMLLREHGYKGQSRNCKVPGYNYRMSNIACAIGLEQLKTLDKRNITRAINVVKLAERMSDHGMKGKITPIKLNEGDFAVHQIFGFLCQDGLQRAHVLNHLIKNGIEAKTYFSPHIVQQEYYKKYSANLPVSDDVASRIICLPFDEHLTKEEMDYMVEKISEVI